MLEIGVQPTGWLDYERLDESFARIKALGFETVDLGFPQVPFKPDEPLVSFYDASVEEILPRYLSLKEAADRHGVTISQAHAPFPLWIKEASDEYNAHMVMALCKICEICAAIGCKNIVAHPITRSLKSDEWETNMALYRAVMPSAVKHGVRICLENLFTVSTGRVTAGVCADAEEAVKYIDTLNEEAGTDAFGFCFDVGHANLVHKELRQYINVLGHRLTILHIHDNDGQNDLHLAPFTQARYYKKCTNALDWEGFILGLKDINYRGTLSFETFRVMSMTPPELYDASLSYISSVGQYFKKRILE